MFNSVKYTQGYFFNGTSCIEDVGNPWRWLYHIKSTYDDQPSNTVLVCELTNIFDKTSGAIIVINQALGLSSDYKHEARGASAYNQTACALFNSPYAHAQYCSALTTTSNFENLQRL